MSDKSHAYRDDQLIVSGYSRVLSQKRRAQLKAQGENFTVLYPYEFLAEFKQVAQYIEAFLQKGYRVWFKARWDDPLEEQIACLPRDKIEIHYDLTQEQLDEVDVCVGSSTSFLHEMYFLGIPIWYLETNANYQEGMVEQGFATRVTLSEVSSKDFDPAIRLQQPQNAERIYAPSRLNELFADDATGDAIA